ncbi:MAG TPA: GTPase [Planctomycetota bacterium]|nr:GTPase [Planctomycetota bacterium]
MSHAATIAAISSPPGAGRRALIRISGPRAGEITRSCCTIAGAPIALAERGAARARLDDGIGEQPVLVLWMPGPLSFTGEDVAEWHVCGAPDLARAALERALDLGAELAAPGEFTRRAFENGRVDLARAEGVLALVAARNEDERRAASALLLGGLSRRILGLREQLVDLRALCEASLDFDERETGGIPREELAALTQGARTALEEALAWEVAREAPSGLPRAVLVGLPNAGKSSLFNRLTQASALVSELAGTTRDALHRPWSTPGAAIELWDAAGTGIELSSEGIRDAADELDWRARERARELARAADLWLWVVDASLGPRDLGLEFQALAAGQNPPPTLLVLHKQDAIPAAESQALVAEASSALSGRIQACVAASSRTGLGLAELEREAGRLLASTTAAGEIRELSARHRAALQAARSWVIEAQGLFSASAALDLAAHALRRATDELDQIEGRTTPEDLLDRIFGRFCLGK